MSERLIAYLFYVALLLTVVGAGAAALTFAADYYFHSRFLAPWHRALQAYRVEGHPWPEFRNNHVAYMEELTGRLVERTAFRPIAAGHGAFMYRLTKPGSADQHVLVLGLPARMVVYGLDMATARRLDRFADGTVDPGAGSFRARPGSGPHSAIVTWSY